MERIEDIVRSGCSADYGELGWLPALPCPMYLLGERLKDAWAVWKGRATAVQWPHQRKA